MIALSRNVGRGLVRAARAVIHEALDAEPVEIPKAAFIDEPGASFVTLRQYGELRGCVGSVEPHRSLFDDVCNNAIAAAFRDPRFLPLKAHELAHTRVEVTVLGIPETLEARSEAAAIAGIEVGLDGLILTVSGKRGVFLPQVWDQVDSAEEFLQHLKLKAGLPAHVWPAGLDLQRFRVQKWSEEPPIEREALS